MVFVFLFSRYEMNTGHGSHIVIPHCPSIVHAKYDRVSSPVSPGLYFDVQVTVRPTTGQGIRSTFPFFFDFVSAISWPPTFSRFFARPVGVL